MRRFALASFVLCAAFVALASLAVANSDGPLIEPSYYEGKAVGLLIPSGSSQNPHQFVSGGGCFPLGPNMNETGREKAANLYALFVPGATQYACPDGRLLHDHVLEAAPGDPGYSGAWRVVVVRPGPNFDEADMPYMSREAVLAGIAAGKLVAVDTDVKFLGKVVPIR